MAVRTNLVNNPSFEVDYSSWVTYGGFGTISRDNTTSTKYGTWASNHTNTTATDGGITSAGFTIPAGTYTFSVWASISSAVTNASMVLRVQTGGAVLAQMNKTYPGNTQFTQYSSTFTTTVSNTVEILLGQGSYGSLSTGTIKYDAVLVELASAVQPYFDGSGISKMSNFTYAWLGTANNSNSTETSPTAPTTDATKTSDVYLGWKNRYLASNGVVIRPYSEGNGDTANSYALASDAVSEGQAYGMALAVQQNDKVTFDLIEQANYTYFDRRNLTATNCLNNVPANSYNLMGYHFNPNNPTLGKGSMTMFDGAAAYDADIDRALSLLWAHNRYGSTGTINYLSRSLAICSDLVAFGLRLDASTNNYIMVSGTGNISIASPEMNNSYQNPAAYKMFAKYDTTNTAKWNLAVAGAYDIINKTALAVLPNPAAPGNTQTTTAKLPANWITYNFSTGAVGVLAATYRDTNYTYDAFRQTNRLFLAYQWYTDTTALARLQDYKSFLVAEWATTRTGSPLIYAEYFHDGSVKNNYESRLFYYAAWLAITANDSSNTTGSAIFSTKLANAYVQSGDGSYYNNSTSGTDISYYSQSWWLIDEMQRQGTYTNYGQLTVISNTTNFFAFF